MKGTPAIYLGKLVDKATFRTNIYDATGKKKLVESWAEYETAMQSGIWFATRENAKESIALVDEVKDEPNPEKKPKRMRAPKSKGKKIYEPPQKAEIIPNDGVGFEVTDENQ